MDPPAHDLVDLCVVLAQQRGWSRRVPWTTVDENPRPAEAYVATVLSRRAGKWHRREEPSVRELVERNGLRNREDPGRGYSRRREQPFPLRRRKRREHPVQFPVQFLTM